MTSNEVQQIMDRLMNLEINLAAQLAVIVTENKDGQTVHSDHEARIRALERVRWIATGAALLIGTGVGGLVEHLAK